jgi:hypothetical protein
MEAIGPALPVVPNDWVNAILETDYEIVISGKISTLFDKNPNIEILDCQELNYNLGANNTGSHGVLSYGNFNYIQYRDTSTKGLFVNNNKIITAEYLQLNVKFRDDDMGAFGWQCLFADCTKLRRGPILMSLNPRLYEYSSCFAGCTSLMEAPALPATTLPSGCYTAMFWGCTSLGNLPVLPATTLGEWAYAYMFYNTNLTITTVPTSVNKYSFKFPTSGTSISVHEDAADYMFNNYASPQPDTVYYTSLPTISE